MKYLDLKELDSMPGKRLEDDDVFTFDCHNGLECFNRCCRNLNLYLYPYDVVRLKNLLNIDSELFLDEYVDIVLRPSSFFPEVLLKMSEDETRSCIFLSESGCCVYSDRPDTCRKFPLEQGAVYDAEEKKTGWINFFRPPDFCKGPQEQKSWTPASWRGGPDGETYNAMTLLWAEVKRLFQTDPWGHEGPEGTRAKMAFMASYNVDRFREFIFKSSFLKRYKVKSAVLKKLEANDEELLKFGFLWIKLFVWGIKTKKIRER